MNPKVSKKMHPHAVKAESKSPAPSEKSDSWFGFLFKPYNVLFAIAALLFLAWCNSSVPSYSWVKKDLLQGGYQYCAVIDKEIQRRTSAVQDPSLKEKIALDTKLEAKLGVEFLILKHIRENTPPDAIILFPPSTVITQKTANITLKWDMAMKAFPSYFLYPRSVVYASEKGRNPLFEKVQYVFILHGWGYEYLDYELPQRSEVDILPIHRENQKTQS